MLASQRSGHRWLKGCLKPCCSTGALKRLAELSHICCFYFCLFTQFATQNNQIMSFVNIYWTVFFPLCFCFVFLTEVEAALRNSKVPNTKRANWAVWCCLCVDVSILAHFFGFMEQFNHWMKVSQPGFFAHWQVHSVSLVTVLCRLCLCFTLDLTRDWRVNLDVCGHTLWVFDSLRHQKFVENSAAPVVAVWTLRDL